MFFYSDSLSFSVQKYNFLRSSGTSRSSRSSRISRQDFIIIIIAVFIMLNYFILACIYTAYRIHNLHKATPSDTLVSGPPPASDFILGFLSHYWISISLFLLRMCRMIMWYKISVIMRFICKIMRFIR